MNQHLIEYTHKYLYIPHSIELDFSDGTIYMGLLKIVNVNLPYLKQETKLIFKIQNMEVVRHYCKTYRIPFNFSIQELAGSSENSRQIQIALLYNIIQYVENYSQYKLRGKGIQHQMEVPISSRNKENIPLNNQLESTNIQCQQFVYQTPQKNNSVYQDTYNQSAQQFASQIHQSQLQRNSVEASQIQCFNNQSFQASIEPISSVSGSKPKKQVIQEQIIQNQMYHQHKGRFQTQIMMKTPQVQFNTAYKSNWKNHSSQYFGSQEYSENDESSCKAQRGQSSFDMEEIAEMINKKVDQLGCTERFLPLLREANLIAKNNLSLLYCFIIDILCTEEDFELLKMRYYLVQAYPIPQEYSQPFSYGQRINIYN